MTDGAESLRRLLFSGDTMTTSDPLLLQVESIYDQPKLKSMPLREQPAYRVSQNASACNVSELLAAIIGAFELTRAGQEVIERTFHSLEIYLVVAAFYFIICYPLSYYTRKIEKRRVTGF